MFSDVILKQKLCIQAFFHRTCGLIAPVVLRPVYPMKCWTTISFFRSEADDSKNLKKCLCLLQDQTAHNKNLPSRLSEEEGEVFLFCHKREVKRTKRVPDQVTSAVLGFIFRESRQAHKSHYALRGSVQRLLVLSLKTIPLRDSFTKGIEGKEICIFSGSSKTWHAARFWLITACLRWAGRHEAASQVISTTQERELCRNALCGMSDCYKEKHSGFIHTGMALLAWLFLAACWKVLFASRVLKAIS